METLSSYARQFIGGMERPEVDKIEGLSPAISIEQKTISHNPRSTVGTVTEIYDFLRLLFARCGTQFSPDTGLEVTRQTIDQILDNIMKMKDGTRINILAPIVKGRKGHYRELFEEISSEGFTKVRVDGEVMDITPKMQVQRFKIHDIEAVVDRVIVNDKSKMRIYDSLDVALRIGKGLVIISSGKVDKLYNEKLSDPVTGRSFSEPAPNMFSFNSHYGWCKTCYGLGEKKEIDVNRVFPNKELSFEEGGIAPIGKPKNSMMASTMRALLEMNNTSGNIPVKDYSGMLIDAIMSGVDKKLDINYTNSYGREEIYRYRFYGMTEYINRQVNESSSEIIRTWADTFLTTSQCKTCGGGRLKEDALWIKTNGKNIHEVTLMPINICKEFLSNLKFDERHEIISRQIIKEIVTRLTFLSNVGLNYMTLDRSAKTLSGGEAQRIRLATQIGSQLTGVLYILDEPSIGLHQRDNIRLIDSLKRLRDMGNTVIVVEHDREMMESADYIVDLGPGAGEHGGYIVAQGNPKNLKGSSVTVDYLKGKKRIDFKSDRRKGNGNYLLLKGASGNNLKEVDLKIPIGKFICISGVSGSGKSTLINETLYPILSNRYLKSYTAPLAHKSFEEKISLKERREKFYRTVDKVIEIDQSPIGRTPRSNPATYTGLFTFVRDIFASLPEAKIRGYKVGRFSFNVKGGRCPTCDGDGLQRIEMNFLPDVYVTCEDCKGKRYNRETLQIRYKGKTIAEVLDMTVEEALGFFESIPSLRRKLKTLHDVGLDYIRLGQQATTLSGGEAQRVKLSTELSKVQTGKTVYILDEPTTGLHFEDIKMLLNVLNKLVDKGNTVIVIEHNLEVIKCADWIIDLGPEGGEEGGRIVAEGTPEELVKKYKNVSYTAKYLEKFL